jgi:signal peptide peptidase SppA
MNLLAYLDSKVWAIESRALNALRMKVSSDNPDMSKLSADFEERKAQLAKAPLGSGMRARLKTGAIGENGVAVINISGPIFNVEGFFDELIAFYFGGTSYQALQADLETIANDGQVKAWGAYVHSPGGEAFGMDETANKIAALTKQKPSIGYAYGLACSAAFGLISSTGKIYADASAWIGSVGVVTQWADFTGFYEKLGIAFEEVTSSNAPFKRLDIRKPEHRAVLMEEIDGVENEFVKLLAKNFGISVEKVRSDFGKGAVMAGRAAKAAGMIHEIGSWADVLKELQKVARKASNTNALGAENEGEIQMGFKDDFKAFAIKHGLMKAEEAENEPAADDPVGTENAAAPEASEAPKVNLEVEKAQLAKEREQMFAEKAKNFADAEVTANRLLPAERDELEASYLQALKDDAASPLTEGSRAAKLEAMQQKRQPHHFTSERIAPDATAKILAGDGAEMSEDREKELLSKTGLGRSGLKLVAKK